MTRGRVSISARWRHGRDELSNGLEQDGWYLQRDALRATIFQASADRWHHCGAAPSHGEAWRGADYRKESGVAGLKMRYPAIIEGGGEDYGIWFPDIDGIGAMGYTIDEALINAGEVLRDYAIEAERDGTPLAMPSALEDVEVPAGSALTTIRLVHTPRDKPSVRLNLVLDADIADTIAAEAKRRGMTRKSYLEWMVRCTVQTGG